MAKVQSVNKVETDEKKPDLTNDIIREVYRLVELMGGDSGILGIIGSWRDTMSDEDTLNQLRDHNDALTIEQL